MKKPFKIAIIVISILLVLVAAASMFVKIYLTEERMRFLVSEMAEKSLNRKVMLGEIKVSLFRGIIVRDFEIREKDTEAVFFRTKDFLLKYQFLPLLSKKLVIDKLSIADVELHLKANPDGTYNFSDMAKPRKPQDHENERGKAAGLPVDLNVKAVTIKNAKLHYIDTTGKLKKADVTMNAELKMTGVSKNILSSEGAFDTTVAEALLKDGNKAFKDIKVDVRYKIDLDMDAKQITVHAINLDVMKIPLTITGTLQYMPEISYSLVMKVPKYDLSQIRQDIASTFLPKGMALGGNVSMLFNITKKNDKGSSPNIDGNVKFANASCTYKKMHLVLDGSLKLTPEMIALEHLELIAGQNRANISGSVRNYKEYPDLNVNIKSNLISLDDLFVSGKSQETAKGNGNETGQASGKGEDVEKEPEPMNLKLKLSASLDIDKTTYKGISMTNFRSRYELKDNILSIPYLTGNTLSGAFALKGSLNLAQKGTRYNMALDLNGVKVEEIINAFAPKARDKLFGVLSGKAVLTGAGTLPANAKRALKGKGEFAIRNGTLKNAELSAGLLAILGLQDLREIPLDKANSQFTISDGIINIATQIASKDMMIDETGTVGMDEKLDLGIFVKVSDSLAPRLVSQSSIAGFLSGEKGWTGLPLKVGGTISKPSFGIDQKAVGKKIREGVEKKIGESLQKILLKDKKQSSGTEQKKSSSPGGFLKELFGK